MSHPTTTSAAAAGSTAADPAAGQSGAAVRLPSRLAALDPRVWMWGVPLLLGVIAALMRFYRLGFPGRLIFDETYYVKDAYTLSKAGYEKAWPDEPNPQFEAGNTSIVLDEPSYVVHPPLGKWILSLGIDMFGADSSFGWRFSAALVGALSVAVLTYFAIRLFRSVWIGGLAGLLMTVDGEHFVHSRTGLLDLFLMFFVLLAFGFLVLDREQTNRRLRDRLALTRQDRRAAASAPDPWTYGPALGFRGWRLAAGITLGCAMGVKWSGLYALAVFGIAVVAWDITSRYRAGVRRPVTGMLIRDSVPAFLLMVPVAFVTYVATWSGWIFTSGGWDRQWAAENPGWWDVLPDWIPGLAHYHASAYRFHVGLSSEHTYMSNPWGWIVQWRPTSFYYESYAAGEHGCMVEKCSSAITSVGNPVIWGLAPVALIVLILAWIVRRDSRAGIILAGFAATWLPWFRYQDRTIFTFYTIVMVPFVCLAIAYCLGLLWGNAKDAAERGQSLLARRLAVAAIGAAAILVFAFFWPVYTGEVIPYDSWRLRMWNPSWI
ncbi:dolichyl-phosphate-mannose--protein mannosyltransferase [Brevibacterium gallinarum]|nr:phospholipid carrier-dependent glycosyltransferase [Brevibacterium gallinarum]